MMVKVMVRVRERVRVRVRARFRVLSGAGRHSSQSRADCGVFAREIAPVVLGAGQRVLCETCARIN